MARCGCGANQFQTLIQYLTAQWISGADGTYVKTERSKPISESCEPDVGDSVPRQLDSEGTDVRCFLLEEAQENCIC